MPWLVGQVYPVGNYEAFQYSDLSAFEQAHPNTIIIAYPFATEQAAEKVVAEKSGGGSGGGGNGGGGGGGHGGSSTGGNRADVVSFALSSIGHAYLYGGAPGTDGNSPWDCSSCVNYNFGVANGLAIPGYAAGTYDGSTHGPATGTWLDAQGTVVGSVDRSEAMGGDIACWQTHMGTFINSDEMVSAENPADGTRRSFVDGFMSGEQLVVLRLAHFGPGGITLPVLSIGDSKTLDRLTREIARSDQDLVWKRMQLQRKARRPF